MRTAELGAEDAMKEMQKIFKKRGKKALEIARKEMLQEKIECREVKEALTYFMNEYWQDLARPSLLSMACEAVGGEPEITTPIAVSLSLISGAVDIHDDIIDQSKTKHERPTVYGKFGKDIALLVGDALLFKGFTLLNQAESKGVPAKKMAIVVKLINEMFVELGDAEALELQFRGNLDVSPEDYLRVVRKKAADVEAHTRISGVLSDATKEKIEALGNYGRILGMLILLRDDWMDIFDATEMRSRVKKESLPLPLLYGLQHSMIKEKLRKLLSKKNLTQEDAESVLKIIQKTDIPKRYAKFMNELAEKALIKLREQNLWKIDLKVLLKTTIS